MNPDVNNTDVQAERRGPETRADRALPNDELTQARGRARPAARPAAADDRGVRQLSQARRARPARDMAERAAESVLADLLPIIDDLERALAAPTPAKAPRAIAEASS